MGLFTSNCINCGKSIDWFGIAPTSYYCNNDSKNCTSYNSSQWIELSWALKGTGEQKYHLNNNHYLNNVKQCFNNYISSLKTNKVNNTRPPEIDGPDLVKIEGY